MDDLEEKSKQMRPNDFEKGSISEGFNSLSKLQNSSTIHSQATMYKFNLAAALHDHISCTKLQPDLSRTEDGGGLFTLSLPKEKENEELNFHHSQDHDDTFKDIILVQLDLIQHQQEQLLKKERQLQQARQDSESLCKRLESMEKEIASLKEQLSRKEENRLGGGRAADFLEVNRDDCLESQLTFTNFLTDLPSTAVDQSSAISKSAGLFEQQTAELASGAPSKKSDDKKRKKAASKSDNLVKEDKKEDKKSITGSKKKKIKDKSSVNDKQRVDSPQASNEPRFSYQQPIKTIETDCPYEIVTNEDFFNALEDDDELDPLRPDDHPSKSDQIEIPSWRIHPISCSYSLEGTENLNDEVFRHRHSKFEMDEKRRKRWDLQRLRESHYNERLRSRYSSKAITSNSSSLNLNSTSTTTSQAPVNCDNNSNDVVPSFYPSPNILKYIEVSERLPVVAFGHCIPDLPAKDFSLPWSSSNNSNSTSKMPTAATATASTNKPVKVANKKT